MSDQDMKLNVEVRTTSDDQGISKLEAKIKTLNDRIKSLGRTGTTKGLDAAFEKHAKAIDKINKAFKPSEAMIGRIEKQLLDTAKAGKLTAAVIGNMTKAVNAYGKASANLSGMSKDDVKAWGEKIVRARAMVQAVQRIGEIQKRTASELLERQGELGDLHKAIHTRNEQAAKRAQERAAKAQNAAVRMGQTDQRLLLDKLALEERMEAGKRIARENEMRHERFLDGGRRRREAEISRIERRTRNRSNAGIDNRINAGTILDQVQTQTARLSTRLGYRGAIEGNLGARALAEYRDGVAKALRAYRSQMRDLRSVPLDQYDPKAETRVQKRLRTERQGLYSVFQEKMTFAREEQRIYDRNERDRLRAIREQERAYQRLKNDAFGGFNQARSSGAQALGAARQPAMIAAAVGAAGIAASLKGIQGKMSVDTAETNLMIFGSEPANRSNGGKQDFTREQVKAARSGWLDQAALANGVNAATGLNAYTEVIKAGVTGKKAETMTQLLMSAGSGMDMPLDEITRVMGKIAQNVPGVDDKRMKNILNSMAISAATTASDPNQIVAGMRRGMGVFSMSNMTPESLAAHTAVGAGAGVQEGKTGNFIAELVSTVMTAGKARGQRKKDLNLAARTLGFGSAQGLSNAGSLDTDAAIEKLLGNFSRLSKAQQALMAQKLGGREWDDEIMQFVNSIDKLRDVKSAINDPRNKDFLDEAQAKRMASWQGKWNRAKAVMSLFWESIGTGFDDVYTQVVDYFTVSGGKFNFGQISNNVQAFLKGFVKGLGFDNVTGLLESVFGKPGQQKLDYVQQLQAFGKGLAEGLKSVFEAVKGLMSVFTLGSSDPEVIGRLTGKIIGLSAALVVLSPLVTVLGGIVAFVSAIAGVARMVGGIAGLMGATGAGGAAGTASAAAIGWPIVGTLIAGAFVGYLSKLGADWIKNKTGDGVTSSAIDMFIRPGGFMGWLAEKGSNLFSDPSAAQKGATGKVLEDAAKGVTPLQKAIEDNTKVQKQSFDQSQKIGSLIKPASFSQSSSSDIQSMGARLQLAALSGGGALSAMGISRSASGGASIAAAGLGTIAGSGGSAALLGATPGQALPGTGFGRRGIIGGGSAGVPSDQFTGDNANVLKQAAASLGATPKDLATVISYETAGKFSPSIRGGKGGNYQGLIQFGPAERAKYGVTGNETFAEQMPKVVRFLKDRGFKPGMGLDKLYATINGGNPYVSQGASDGNGTIASHVAKMQAQHGARAQAFLDSGSGSNASLSPASGAAGTAADNAAKLLGAGSGQAAAALGSRMTAGQWCADFVNGALKSANIKGVNSSIATSFMGWGQQVLDGVKKGDVVVENRGRGMGQTGGHVGLATGRIKVDERSGRTFAETISGNHGGRVGRSWVDTGRAVVRRSEEALAGKPGTYGNPQDDSDITSKTGWQKAGAEDLAAESPAQKLARSAPKVSQGGAGAHGAAKVTAPINIQHIGDAQSTANAVQRRIQDVSGYHSQNRSYESI